MGFCSGESAVAACAEGVFGGQTRTNGAGSGEKGEFGVYNRVLPIFWQDYGNIMAHSSSLINEFLDRKLEVNIHGGWGWVENVTLIN